MKEYHDDIQEEIIRAIVEEAASDLEKLHPNNLSRHYRDLDTPRPKNFRDPIQGWSNFLQFLYNKKTFETIFQEVINDWREEYYECLDKGKLNKASFEVFKGRLTLLIVMIVLAFSYPLNIAIKLFKLIP